MNRAGTMVPNLFGKETYFSLRPALLPPVPGIALNGNQARKLDFAQKRLAELVAFVRGSSGTQYFIPMLQLREAILSSRIEDIVQYGRGSQGRSWQDAGKGGLPGAGPEGGCRVCSFKAKGSSPCATGLSGGRIVSSSELCARLARIPGCLARRKTGLVLQGAMSPRTYRTCLRALPISKTISTTGMAVIRSSGQPLSTTSSRP